MAVADLLIFVLIVAGVFVLTTLLFGGWVLVKIVGLVGRGLASLIGVPPTHRPALAGPPTLRCPRPKCHAANAPPAKFCRRCGVAMAGEPLVARHGTDPRRPAMW